ncbi:MAG: hypothetical protein KF831_16635 [Acidobacteria bacterium]|nr:hypothetical protein [Acidobacteriota bacterium]
MAGYKYFWTCPNCGTSLELKMRVTQTRRKCPHCGFLVTPEEIDNQAWWQRLGCLLLLFLLCGLPAFLIFVSESLVGTQSTMGVIVVFLGLLVLSAVGFLIFRFFGSNIKKNRSEGFNEVHREEKDNAESLTSDEVQRLRTSSDFELIRNFVRSGLLYEDGAWEKLSRLMNQKGWRLSEEEIYDLVDHESDLQLFEEQSKQLIESIEEAKPTSREEYITAYNNFIEPHQERYIAVLGEMLGVPENEYDDLLRQVRQSVSNSDLESFERTLRKNPEVD